MSPVLDIACDESGADGENLVGGNTLFFSHAGIDLPIEVAGAHIQEIRRRIRSPAEEYKANHLLREKHRAVLEWLLAPGGPLHGHAHVHLIDKRRFLLERLAEVLIGDAEAAGVLWRERVPVFAEAEWREFLGGANRILRIRTEDDPQDAIDGFFRTVGVLRRAHPGTACAEFLGLLEVERAVSHRAAPTPLIPLLDPLFPAILRTAAHWATPVHLSHDRQTLLTPERISWLCAAARARGVRLAGVSLVRARHDPRVQLADFLAGIARKIADDQVTGAGDPALMELLRPYVSPSTLTPLSVKRSPTP